MKKVDQSMKNKSMTILLCLALTTICMAQNKEPKQTAENTQITESRKNRNGDRGMDGTEQSTRVVGCHCDGQSDALVKRLRFGGRGKLLSHEGRYCLSFAVITKQQAEKFKTLRFTTQA
ncbi:MAG: hypothetical protein WAV20_24405 [Blastocatellia bacterium]